MSAILKLPSYGPHSGPFASTGHATEPEDASFVFDIVYACSYLCQHLDAGILEAQRVKLFFGGLEGGLLTGEKAIERARATIMDVSTFILRARTGSRPSLVVDISCIVTLVAVAVQSATIVGREGLWK